MDTSPIILFDYDHNFVKQLGFPDNPNRTPGVIKWGQRTFVERADPFRNGKGHYYECEMWSVDDAEVVLRPPITGTSVG